MSNFAYITDEEEANKYLSEGFTLLRKKELNNKETWIFSLCNKNLNFDKSNKSKILITNKLMF